MKPEDEKEEKGRLEIKILQVLQEAELNDDVSNSMELPNISKPKRMKTCSSAVTSPSVDKGSEKQLDTDPGCNMNPINPVNMATSLAQSVPSASTTFYTTDGEQVILDGTFACLMSQNQESSDNTTVDILQLAMNEVMQQQLFHYQKNTS